MPIERVRGQAHDRRGKQPAAPAAAAARSRKLGSGGAIRPGRGRAARWPVAIARPPPAARGRRIAAERAGHRAPAPRLPTGVTAAGLGAVRFRPGRGSSGHGSSSRPRGSSAGPRRSVRAAAVGRAASRRVGGAVSGPVSSARYSGQRASSSAAVPTSRTPPGVEDRDPVGQRQRRAAVGDEQRRPAGCLGAQRLVDLRPRPRRRRPRWRRRAPAPAGRRAAPGPARPAAAARRTASAPAHRPPCRSRRAARSMKPSACGGPGGGRISSSVASGAAEGDVGRDRVGEQEAVLEHQPDRAAQVGAATSRDVDPFAVAPGQPTNPATVVEPWQQQRDRADFPDPAGRPAPPSPRGPGPDRVRRAPGGPSRSRTARARARTPSGPSGSGIACAGSGTSGRVSMTSTPARRPRGRAEP